MITRNTGQKRFEHAQDGLTSIATYEESSGLMVITHVIVPTPLRGRGIATALAKEIVETARHENFKIVPQCPFMAAYFQRHQDARDVMA